MPNLRLVKEAGRSVVLVVLCSRLSTFGLFVNIYSADKVVSAVCHDVAALLHAKNIKRSKFLFAGGRRFTGFSNSEEIGIHAVRAIICSRKRSPMWAASIQGDKGLEGKSCPNSLRKSALTSCCVCVGACCRRCRGVYRAKPYFCWPSGREDPRRASAEKGKCCLSVDSGHCDVPQRFSPVILNTTLFQNGNADWQKRAMNSFQNPITSLFFVLAPPELTVDVFQPHNTRLASAAS